MARPGRRRAASRPASRPRRERSSRPVTSPRRGASPRAPRRPSPVSPSRVPTPPPPASRRVPPGLLRQRQPSRSRRRPARTRSVTSIAAVDRTARRAGAAARTRFLDRRRSLSVGDRRVRLSGLGCRAIGCRRHRAHRVGHRRSTLPAWRHHRRPRSRRAPAPRARDHRDPQRPHRYPPPGLNSISRITFAGAPATIVAGRRGRGDHRVGADHRPVADLDPAGYHAVDAEPDVGADPHRPAGTNPCQVIGLSGSS